MANAQCYLNVKSLNEDLKKSDVFPMRSKGAKPNGVGPALGLKLHMFNTHDAKHNVKNRFLTPLTQSPLI